MAFLVPDDLAEHPEVSAPLRRVGAALRAGLGDDVLAWFEPPFDPAGERPHFVLLLPDRGIAVLEVLEAAAPNVLGLLRGRLRLERDGQEVEVRSPLARAERHAAALAERVAVEPRLAPSSVPVVAGAAFPGLTAGEAAERGLARSIDPRRCLFREELDAALGGDPALLRAGVARLFEGAAGGTRSAPLTGDAVALLRALIQPSLALPASPTAADGPQQLSVFRAPEPGGAPLRVLDRPQEALARALGGGHRVIRGVAGSGKTLVLVHRARLLARAHPARRYLLTCFTRPLAGQLAHLLRDLPNVEVKHLDRLMSEVIRAAGREHPGYGGDARGEAVARLALEALRELGRPRYHGVLLDEGQDFGTAALQFVVQLLAEGSEELVIAADAAQNIFRRRWSWKQAGIQAQGRTRLLRVNYRNTREILEFAYRFLTGGAPATAIAPDPDDEAAVIPPEAAQRSGPAPEVRLCPGPVETAEAVVDRVRTWLSGGAQPRGIAVLHGPGASPAELRDALRAGGVDPCWLTDPEAQRARLRLHQVTAPVILSTIHSAKGLEFPRVVVCGLGWPGADGAAEASRRLAYVGMTRATEALCVVARADEPLAGALRATAEVGAANDEGREGRR